MLSENEVIDMLRSSYRLFMKATSEMSSERFLAESSVLEKVLELSPAEAQKIFEEESE